MLQDWYLLAGGSSGDNGGEIHFAAQRLVDTGDPSDWRVVPDADPLKPHRFIAAWGDSPDIQYHGPDGRVRGAIRFHPGDKDVGIGAASQSPMQALAADDDILVVEIGPSGAMIPHDAATTYMNYCFDIWDKIDPAVVAAGLHMVGFEFVHDAASVGEVAPHRLVEEMKGGAWEWKSPIENNRAGESRTDQVGGNSLAHVCV